MRKLASIQKVINVEPIPGADRIEKITVLGWTLISKRGEFTAGDLCVYFEIDSVLPDKDIFSFLWKTDDNGLTRAPSFRLRSKKMKGVISQGLALPLSILPESITPVEGVDVTDTLGIVKWEPPSTSSAREVEGPFPTHLFPKTDELRIQSIPEILKELNGVDCYAAIKLDGQSLSFAKITDGDGTKDIVCSRNLSLRNVEGSPHWDAAKRLNIFENLPADFVIQGEFCGPGIQSNRLGLKQKAFYAFQVFDIGRQEYLDFLDFKEFCSSRAIPTVPVEWQGPLTATLPELLDMANGKYDSGHPREGLVIRPVKEANSKVISDYTGQPSRASFKVISNEYLLKIGE